MRQTQEAKIITPQEIDQMEQQLPESWKKAAGLLRSKKNDLEKHLKRVRKEWDQKQSYDH
jgi:hypothetical protein